MMPGKCSNYLLQGFTIQQMKEGYIFSVSYHSPYTNNMRYLFTICTLFITGLLQAQSPDLILYNGKIFTADQKQLYVQAVAIRGERITAVGGNTIITKMKGKDTKMIDLQGKTVIPGINDAHSHTGPEYPSRYFNLQQLPTDPTSWERISDSITKIVKDVPAGTLIRSVINPDLFADSRACRAGLDLISGSHPVILSAWTGHGTLCNSKALALLGFDEQSTYLGGWFSKDADQKNSGIINEYASYRISSILNARLEAGDISKQLAGYYKEALSFGITSDQVMATQFSAKQSREIFAKNDFGVRTRIIAFPVTGNNKILVSDWAGSFSKLNRKNVIAGVKLIIDGTPIERLACVSAPYSDAPHTSGHINFSDKVIGDFFAFCLRNKQQILVHAVGDSSVKTMIRVMLAMHPASFWKTKRVRIEHADLAIMKDADISLIKQLGIVIVQNPTHLGLPQLMMPRLNNRTAYLQAMRSLLNNDIPLAIGSDGPINPFLNIMLAAIHPDNPKEAISIEEAVIAYTKGSAYAEFTEKEKGTLAVGKYADLAVLSQDIFTVPLNTLPVTQSVMTIVGGKILHRAEGRSGL